MDKNNNLFYLNTHKPQKSELQDKKQNHLIHLIEIQDIIKWMDDSVMQTKNIYKKRTFDGHQGTINSFVMDDNYVLTGSEDNSVKLYDRESGKCLHSIQPEYNPNMRPQILVSPVNAVNMNHRQIAIGYNVGEMHLYDKTTGEQICQYNVSGIRSKIEKIMFTKFNCDLYPDQNCYFDESEVDVIITSSGGILSVVFIDSGEVGDLKANKYQNLNPHLEFNTKNYCGWDGNCRLDESVISDFAIDHENKLLISTENLVYQFSPPFTNDSLPDVTQTFSKAINSMSVNRNELICGLEDGTIQIMDREHGKTMQEIPGHGSMIEQISAIELRK